MASGATTLREINNEEFKSWVSALALIRVVERPVEGLHSRISGVLKRAPSASVSLISNELRFPSLCDLLISQPQAGWMVLFCLA